MKRIMSFTAAILAIIALSISLFISGKGHDIYFTNNAPEGIEPYKEIVVNIDGNKRAIKVKNGKKAVGVAKGKTHTLIISYKENGEKKEKEFKFKTYIGKEVEISLVGVILDFKDPVAYKDKEEEQPKEQEGEKEQEEPKISEEQKMP